ncbi:hypothetical protein ACHQM5_013200 [Ranunculus cassubicifolius]
MALRDDFEGLRGSILHRIPLPSVDSVVSELLAEEVRFKSQSMKVHHSVPSSSVLAVPFRSSSKSQYNSHAEKVLECRYYKEYGHLIKDCPSLLRKTQKLAS